MAREVSGREVLEIEKFLVGTARTSSSNSWVTDSAAGKIFLNLIFFMKLQLHMLLVSKLSIMLLVLIEI